MSFNIQCSENVPYTRDQMYALVSDIQSYGTFMKGYQSKVHHDDGKTVRATLSFSGLSFTTQNTLHADKSRMDLSLFEGPFEQFDGRWLFEDLEGGGTKVTLILNFELSLLKRALASLINFEAQAAKLVNDFVAEAHRRYGNAEGTEEETRVTAQ